VVYRINFHLPSYEFRIGLYLNFGKWLESGGMSNSKPNSLVY
jgi:hypothetical protein